MWYHKSEPASWACVMTCEIREVADGTFAFDCGRDPVFDLRQVAYVLDGDAPTIIDPGSTSAAKEVLENAARAGLKKDSFQYIIPTHIHLDHAGGAGFLARELPAARVVLHPAGIKHMVAPERLIQNFRAVFGDNFEETLGAVLPVPQERIVVAEEGMMIDLGRRKLGILFTPGHATHHISITDTLTGGIYCGDALGYICDETPDIAFPVGLPPFDPESYVVTIDRLAALSPNIICYAHHGARQDVGHLLSTVREICLGFSEIVQEAQAAGASGDIVAGNVHNYASKFCPRGLPMIVEASISGYTEFYKRKAERA